MINYKTLYSNNNFKYPIKINIEDNNIQVSSSYIGKMTKVLLTIIKQKLILINKESAIL